MKFYMSKYFSIMYAVGIIMCASVLLLFVWGSIFVAESDDAAGLFLFSLLPLGVIVILLRDMNRDALAKVYFNRDGIHKEGWFGLRAFISWEECKEIGVLAMDVGGYGIRNWKFWLCFSKTKSHNPLSHTYFWDGIKTKKHGEPDNIIMLEYRPEVLDEVLRYVGKDQIRNLHLIRLREK